MRRLVEVVAPLTWRGVAIRSLAVLGAVHAGNLVAGWLSQGIDYSVRDTIPNTVLGLPFVGGLMAILMHLRRLQGELLVLATTDVLTGLPNRRAFLARTAEAIEGGRAGALLVLDADHFKQVNDTWGHAVGDACLVAIAHHLRRCLRPGDVVGRVGGEEFAAFLPGATHADAVAVGERLCQEVAVEAARAEASLRVTLSIGAALGGARLPLDRLMARADQALYRAKAAGRARVVLWPDGCGEAEAPDRAA